VNPFATALFAWQAATVCSMRSWQLLTEPAQAQARLTEYVLEKQRAFTEGALKAGEAAMRGADGPAVMAAALRPAQRRVAANVRMLRKP
jgi:hypothetical protein